MRKLLRENKTAFSIYLKSIKAHKCNWLSRVRTLCDLTYYIYSLWNSPGQNTRVGSLSLLQGIFPTQGSNPGLPHCSWILYQLS